MQLAIILGLATFVLADEYSNANAGGTVSIPLSVDGDGRYCAYVAMVGGIFLAWV